MGKMGNWLTWLIVGGGGLTALWLSLAWWTMRIAQRHGGHPGRWFLYGVLLGPIGIWLAFRMVRPCPACQAIVLRDVHLCPACGHEIPRLGTSERPEDYLKTYRKNW
jgi:hypothetical protein